MELIMPNPVDIIVLAMVGALIAICIMSLRHDRKAGIAACSGCGHRCSSCALSCCHKQKIR